MTINEDFSIAVETGFSPNLYSKDVLAARGLLKRALWIAAHPMFLNAATTQWYTTGLVNLLKNGEVVGSIPFAFGNGGGRLSPLLFGDGAQPGLYFRRLDLVGANTETGLVVPALDLGIVDCDVVQYRLAELFDAGATDGTFVTGLRILSCDV